MMGRKSRELLKELLGEENFERYENGDGIRIESPDGHTYQIEKRQGYADIIRETPATSYRYRSTDSGRLRAFDIDDGVATFVENARLGRVDWACGNMDVDLPKNMPPRNTSFMTFLLRGMKSMIYYLRIFPGWYANHIRNSDAAPVIFAGILFPWLGGMVILINFESIVPPLLGWAVLLFPIYMGIFTYYIRWKREWEVKLN